MEMLTKIVLIFILFLKTCYAIKSINKGLQNNDPKIYKQYFIYKIIFIISWLLEITYRLISNFMGIDATTDQLYGYYGIIFFLIWIVVYESYISMVIYSFYKKTLRGEYGPLNAEPILLPIIEVETKKCKPILLEGKKCENV